MGFCRAAFELFPDFGASPLFMAEVASVAVTGWDENQHVKYFYSEYICKYVITLITGILQCNFFICGMFFEGSVLSQRTRSAPQRRGTEVGEARPAERMSARGGRRDVLMASVPSVSRLGALRALCVSSGIGAA
jgi:hypothetical protein